MAEQVPGVFNIALQQVRKVGEAAGSMVVGLANTFGVFESSEDYARRIAGERARLKGYEKGIEIDLSKKSPAQYGAELRVKQQVEKEYEGYL